MNTCPCTGCQDITEILLKTAFNAIQPINLYKIAKFYNGPNLKIVEGRGFVVKGHGDILHLKAV